MSERRPNRTLGGPHDAFWEYCRKGELRLQQCSACQAFAWPPVEQCERCGGDFAWVPVSGSGKLVSWCTFEHSYYPDLPVPWDTILVELDEGPLFLSNPRGFSRIDMTAHMPVRVVFIDCEDDAGPFSLPVFEHDSNGAM
jgi:uncharacterized OB-fold protein